MQPHGLVVAPPALPARTSRLTYLRGAVASPVSLSVAAFAGCVGLGYAGVLGAALAALAVLGIAAHGARYPRVRAYIEHQRVLQARARRERRRIRALRPVGATRLEQYNELRALVDEIERLDAAEARRFELQDLLDHYIRLAVDHRRCSDALHLASSCLAPVPMTPPDAARSRRRRDIIQRRMQHRDLCTRRMERLSDELAAIDEMIRLVAQRVACPDLEGDVDRELDRRLWELDEVDAALHQLSA